MLAARMSFLFSTVRNYRRKEFGNAKKGFDLGICSTISLQANLPDKNIMFIRGIAYFAFATSLAFGKEIKPGDSLSAESKAGKGLLSKARKLNDDRDVTFVAKYDIKYKGCSSLVQFREEGGGQDEGFLYSQNLAKFSLCPSDESCSECKNGAEYVINMMDFVAAYTEYKLEVQEQACENVRENCNNDDENACYYNAGMEECIENEDGEEEFNLEEYLECKEMENQNDNNNNNNGNNNQYFIGPYCSEYDGWSIHLGVFSDEGCFTRASSSVFSNANYGQELPYSSDPIVESDCISCMQVDDNEDNNNQNNQNNQNNYYYEELEVNEFCDGLYEEAAKCETNLEINYKDTSACEYIEYVLPRLESAIRSSSVKSSSSSGGHPAATAFAWIFGLTSILFGAYAYFLYGKLARSNVNLSSSDGALA